MTTQTASPRPRPTAGERFVRALAAKDPNALRDVLADDVDFGALTPRQHWDASGPDQLIDDVLLGRWFEPSDHIEELCSVTDAIVADRQHIAYRFRVRNGDGEFLVEQQAYYTEHNDKINWLRVLCSGFRPARR